ncbi:hypothetical protein BS78_03G254300 [Paspalum vaginatum]|nr:hypothetical protein BS78_03G254300 [Paspalum vaginatum]
MSFLPLASAFRSSARSLGLPRRGADRSRPPQPSSPRRRDPHRPASSFDLPLPQLSPPPELVHLSRLLCNRILKSRSTTRSCRPTAAAHLARSLILSVALSVTSSCGYRRPKKEE